MTTPSARPWLGTALQGLAALVMTACALITLQAVRTPPVLVLDETRDVAMLSPLDTGANARAIRCKAVLVNIGAILTAGEPFAEDERARRYAAAWVTEEALLQEIWRYREFLQSRFNGTPIDVLLRTGKDRDIQLYRGGRHGGYLANLTYTVVRAFDHRELMSLSFEAVLVKTPVTLANPMGYALQTFQPLDPETWEETP